jgi:hypothetical protein
MKPNALESNREEGLDLVASLSQMLNIWRKALGCERIVRTPKFMYFPRKNISVTGSNVLFPDTIKPASSSALTTRAVTTRKRAGSGPKIKKSSK